MILFVEVFLIVDVFQNDIVLLYVVLLEDWLVDELGPEVYLEGSLQEERDVVEEEAEGEVAELVLHVRGIVEVVRSKVFLSLLQQLLCLQLVVDQLALLLVHLRLQAAQPTIEVMLTEGMRDFLIVLQRILKILLSWRVLRLR